MQKAALLAIAIGTAAGLMMPSGKSGSQAPAATVQDGSAKETRLKRKSDGHFYVNAEVNGELVHFLIDTGATGVALTEDDAKRVGIDFSPGEFDVVGRGASGDVRGKLVSIDRVSVDGKEAREVRGIVIEGGDISLLGQAYLSRLASVQMSGDHMVLR